MRKVFLRWWAIFCISGLGLLGLHFFGPDETESFLEYIWSINRSKLSFVILSLYGIVSLRIGQLTYHLNNRVVHYHSMKPLKEAADWMLAMGLIGTLFGFYWVLVNSFIGVDISQTDQIKAAMNEIGSGMGTAVITSLVGMTSSLVTRIQITNLESGYDRRNQRK